MMRLSDLYGWLNQQENSHLSNNCRYAIWHIENPEVTGAQKNAMIEALVQNTLTGQDDCEKAEVLVFAGKSQAERRNWVEAQTYLSKALSRYVELNEQFRGAVTRLMLSTVQWQTGDNYAAFANLRAARAVFERMANSIRRSIEDNANVTVGYVTQVNWLVEKIDLINEDLIQQPEEAFEWLVLFQESFLSSPARKVREAIRTKLENRDFFRANQQLAELIDMVRRSQEPKERAEVLAFCGLANYQMGNVKAAESYFRQSASLFPPDRHHQTVVRWMHAMVLAKDSYRLGDAIRIGNDCITCLESLRLDAEHANKAAECSWYEDKANRTRRIVERLAERV